MYHFASCAPALYVRSLGRGTGVSLVLRAGIRGRPSIGSGGARTRGVALDCVPGIAASVGRARAQATGRVDRDRGGRIVVVDWRVDALG